MRAPALSLLLLCSLMGCDRAVTAPSADQPDFAVTSNETEPFEFTATACNGEDVPVSGQAHHLVTLTTTPGGNVHVTDHIVVQAKGTGQTTGALYHLREVGNLIANNNGPLPQTFTFEDTGGMVAQGNADDFRFKIHVHVTINANGTTTADVFGLSFICK